MKPYPTTMVSGVLTTEDGHTIRFERAFLQREPDIEEGKVYPHPLGDVYMNDRVRRWNFTLELHPDKDGVCWYELAPGVALDSLLTLPEEE